MDGNKKFQKLLEPGYIGPVKTRNRMIKTGASMCYWHEDDTHMREEVKAYYGAIARGGIGLLIVEAPTLDYPLGTRWQNRYRIDDDKYIDGLKELVDVIKKYDCPVFSQMWHDGPWQNPLFPNYPPVYEGPPIGASPVNLDTMADFNRDIPRVLTIPEIEEIVDKWASAAVRIQKAGFDGIDINAGSSHLMHNFLSPFWNRREDDYGGSTENRARFLVQIIREIKSRAGQEFAIQVVLNGIEVGQAFGIDNNKCLTHEESQKIARLIQEAGADALHVRNHWLGYHVPGFLPDYLFYPAPPIPVEDFPKEYNWRGRGAGANEFLAASMKKILSIPITVVGKISPELGEEILRAGKADFIGMTRALQCDPEMPNKLAEGRMEDIAPCTACGTCLDQSEGMARHCRINAAMGSTQYTVDKADRRRKVAVVGGGPAGLEAARVAALRGHEVTLYEKTSQLGGLIPLAALIKGIELEDLPKMLRYLKTQVRKLGVKVNLGQEFTAATADETKPDVVIVATGGTLTVPEMTGIGSRKVVTTPALHQRVKPYLKFFGPRALGWLTKFWLPIGKKVVVIGSGLHGMEVAEFLLKRDRKVTIVDTAENIGENMLDFRLGLLMDWFGRIGVEVIPGLKSIKITDQGVAITNGDGITSTIEADSVIPTSPLVPNTALAESLKGKVSEVYTIGDCKESGMIVHAIRDGWHTARVI